MDNLELSCLLCGCAKEPSTRHISKGCFICVDCIYQHNEYINMVNLAAQERRRAIEAEARLAQLEQAMTTLTQKWHDAAVWEFVDDMANTQSVQTFDQCADELAALVRARPTPPETT